MTLDDVTSFSRIKTYEIHVNASITVKVVGGISSCNGEKLEKSEGCTIDRPTYSPKHCGRHLGKINGHNSTYVKVWRCTFGQITQVLMGKSWGKLL